MITTPVFVGAPGSADSHVVNDVFERIDSSREIVDTNVEFRKHRAVEFVRGDKTSLSQRIMNRFVEELEKKKGSTPHFASEVCDNIIAMAETGGLSNSTNFRKAGVFETVSEGDSITEYNPFRLFETVMIEQMLKEGELEGKFVRLSGSFGLYEENRGIFPADRYTMYHIAQEGDRERIADDIVANLEYPIDDLTQQAPGTDRRGRYEMTARKTLAKLVLSGLEERAQGELKTITDVVASNMDNLKPELADFVTDAIASKTTELTRDSIEDIVYYATGSFGLFRERQELVTALVGEAITPQIKADQARNPIIQASMDGRCSDVIDLDSRAGKMSVERIVSKHKTPSKGR